MNRKERLMATLQGRKVDRPAVCLYELNGLDQDFTDSNPFNVYNDTSWKTLLELATYRSDRIVIRKMPGQAAGLLGILKTESYYDSNGSLHTVRRIRSVSREFRQHFRRDRDIDTAFIIIKKQGKDISH